MNVTPWRITLFCIINNFAVFGFCMMLFKFFDIDLPKSFVWGLLLGIGLSTPSFILQIYLYKKYFGR